MSLTFKKYLRYPVMIFLIGFLVACSSNKGSFYGVNNYLIDYSKNSVDTKNLISRIKNAKNTGLNIVQLGDSHTAADMMSGALRKKLQSLYGIGSVGFIEPIAVPGQGNQLVRYRSENVSLINSRKQRDYDYLFGGLVASFIPDSWVEYSLTNSSGKEKVQLISRCTTGLICGFVLKSDLGERTIKMSNSEWRTMDLEVKGNFRITSLDTMEVAGLYIFNKNKGVTLSSSGSNGATINHLDVWGDTWTRQLARLKPDLIILAYGTNESYQSNFNQNKFIQDYNNLIKKIKSKTDAQILLLTNPDSLNLKVNRNLDNTACSGKQHANAALVHKAINTVARKNNLLVWDWTAAMGGQCSMLDYMSKGLAAADGVHFKRSAYEMFGRKLAQDLVALAATK